ncbi:hypothetical protein R1521_05460 [Rhizobium brockwellii]|uniref:Lipoprotein n=2 Tax=Rhizobium TaxID=379 RepID=A0ABU3YGI5_9HYPH|nr:MULTISPECIES: hypothetical protein [Rhizobium]MDV4177951.1 hypothetical protein [Rhizobium brockwellii]MDV4184950.1 hypothetical protein [Rhizobium brockwellii]RWY88387.1 hypothetical protein EHI44_09940 [Rhizobium leguminosarum]TAU83534.1 hypothetical protein ELI40_09725 [Rhizobium leguminosarum]TAU88696.1 hypothetical protein ELI41_09055 [Rhizobium leguminosarum]
MSRFFPLVAGVLISVSAFTSSCTSPARQDHQDFQYQRNTSVNPACADGFRPSNARSCSY